MASGKDGDQGGPRGGTSRRGFASMDPERQRAIASKGGKAAHQSGNAHEFTPEEARRAGSKGGKAAHERGTAHEFTSEEARRAGRKGGEASGGGRGRTDAAHATRSGVGGSGSGSGIDSGEAAADAGGDERE
ncbi:KGG domain-containing protein [Ramlibacter rhizophilus]|uniref:Stress-induced protein n=1 Tax=Ramlibacter rhizophilus TaxID=1781167 RepID=A0A4Z0BFN7_9BURK|nr:KGG domain-containing protein [Ramlibacter rhizophilus]TFY98122.1 stress-induced protein [Ramlibacter rhizophilus]